MCVERWFGGGAGRDVLMSCIAEDQALGWSQYVAGKSTKTLPSGSLIPVGDIDNKQKLFCNILLGDKN